MAYVRCSVSVIYDNDIIYLCFVNFEITHEDFSCEDSMKIFVWILFGRKELT